jgi:hypothetical protein
MTRRRNGGQPSLLWGRLLVMAVILMIAWSVVRGQG